MGVRGTDVPRVIVVVPVLEVGREGLLSSSLQLLTRKNTDSSLPLWNIPVPEQPLEYSNP